MASRALFNHQLTRTLKRPGVRLNTTFNSKFAQERNAVKEHAGKAADTWKKISLFVCIPALLATGINAYNLAVAHEEHMKHHPHQWVHYPYLNMRAHDFFWGKESLFYNPKVNHSAAED
ncbi:hypothetical protein LRAMOSA02101 [Lichtheimia ramosa]|uniref:Cytochrome c oxidase subunit 6a n=1 Tax=Lichtheimia ramosa TaxID=688394 RepID=A0A077WLW7_9FUNG|nr:hypothetical protein LRAMOSA02101 [Lichtheimia ramosa]